MSEKIIWDYSQVPNHKWKWYLYRRDDHWMDLEIESS